MTTLLDVFAQERTTPAQAVGQMVYYFSMSNVQRGVGLAHTRIISAEMAPWETDPRIEVVTLVRLHNVREAVRTDRCFRDRQDALQFAAGFLEKVLRQEKARNKRILDCIQKSRDEILPWIGERTDAER